MKPRRPEPGRETARGLFKMMAPEGVSPSEKERRILDGEPEPEEPRGRAPDHDPDQGDLLPF